MSRRKKWTEVKVHSAITKLLNKTGKKIEELTASDLRRAGLYYACVELFGNLNTLKKNYQILFGPNPSGEAFENQVIERPDLNLSKLKILEVKDPSCLLDVMREFDLRKTASRYAYEKTKEYEANEESLLEPPELINKFNEYKDKFFGELKTVPDRDEDALRKRKVLRKYAKKLVKFKSKNGRFPTGTELNFNFQYLYKLIRKNDFVLEELYSLIEEIFLYERRSLKLINNYYVEWNKYITEWSEYIDCLKRRYTEKLCDSTTFKSSSSRYPCNKRHAFSHCLLANKNN